MRPDSATAKPEEAHTEANLTASQARRTVTFWLFAMGDFWVSALGTGLVFHHYAIMAEGGLDRIAAATVFIPLALVSAAANLATGVLLDRIPPRFLLSVSLLCLVAALVLAPRVSSPELIVLYGIILGASQGMRGALAAGAYAYYFGRKHIGAIKGFATTITVAGSSLGPLLFALGFEWFGNYGLIFLLSALLPLAQALAAPFFKPLRADGSVA